MDEIEIRNIGVFDPGIARGHWTGCGMSVGGRCAVTECIVERFAVHKDSINRASFFDSLLIGEVNLGYDGFEDRRSVPDDGYHVLERIYCPRDVVSVYSGNDGMTCDASNAPNARKSVRDMTPVVRDVVGISKNGWNTAGCWGSLEKSSTAQKAFRDGLACLRAGFILT